MSTPKIHNPAGLARDQIPPGHRLLDEDEIDERFYLEIPTLYMWLRKTSEWDGGENCGNEPTETYCTALSRAALRAARNLPPEQASTQNEGDTCKQDASAGSAEPQGSHAEKIANEHNAAIQAERSKVEELTRELSESKDALQLVTLDRRKLQGEVDLLRQQLTTLQAELPTLRAEVTRLRQQLEEARAWKHTFEVLGGTPELAWEFHQGLEANKIAWERKAEEARAELAKEREEQGEAWEQLGAQFPMIQVDCDNVIEAAQFIIEDHKKLRDDFETLSGQPCGRLIGGAE